MTFPARSARKLLEEANAERSIQTYEQSVLKLIAKTLPDRHADQYKTLLEMCDDGWPLQLYVEPKMLPDTTMSVLCKNPRKVHLVRDYLDLAKNAERSVGVIFPIKGVSKYMIVHDCCDVSFGNYMALQHRDRTYLCEMFVDFLLGLF